MALQRAINNKHALSKVTTPFITLRRRISTNNNNDVVNKLISIFTKNPDIATSSSELRGIAPLLTTRVVESVLKSLKSWKIAHSFFTWASTQDGFQPDAYTFNAMASILSRARQNASLKSLAIEVVGSRCYMSPGALGFFVRCLGDSGLAREAGEVFDGVRETGLCVPDRYSYNCLLEALSKGGLIELIELRLDEIRKSGLGFDKYTLTPVLRAYCNAGKVDKALGVFNEIHEQGWVDGYVFTVLVVSCSKWGLVDKAFELIELMDKQGIALSEKTFYVLIHGFVREGGVDKALWLYEKMCGSGVVPNVSVYDVLVGEFCKKKDFDKVLRLCIEMKEMGVRPDVKVLSKIVSSFTGEREMMQLLDEIPGETNAEAMILVYNSILSAFVNNNWVDKAYHLLCATTGGKCDVDLKDDKLVLKVIKLMRPDTTSFVIVVDGLLQNAKVDMALGLFQRMVQIGCKPNVLLYNNLIDGLCSSNRLDESFELFRGMKEAELQPTHFTYNSIFGCLCRRMDVLGAVAILKEMRVHGHEPWIKHSTTLVKQLCRYGKANQACDFLDSMVQEGFLPDIVAYSAVLDGLIKIQELDHALNLFRCICARGHCPDVVAYNIIIKGLCKAKRMPEAENFLNEMMVKGLVPSLVTYNLFIDGWCNNGDTDRAMLFISTMFKEKQEPNIITYTALVGGLCNAGKPDDALALWEEMLVKGCHPNRIAFMALIQGLCKCGKPDAALVFLCKMEEENFEIDTYVFAALITAFLADGNSSFAFQILQEMVEKCRFPEPQSKDYLLLRDAIWRLSEDATTGPLVQKLSEEGGIPLLASLSDSSIRGDLGAV